MLYGRSALTTGPERVDVSTGLADQSVENREAASSDQWSWSFHLDIAEYAMNYDFKKPSCKRPSPPNKKSRL